MLPFKRVLQWKKASCCWRWNNSLRGPGALNNNDETSFNISVDQCSAADVAGWGSARPGGPNSGRATGFRDGTALDGRQPGKSKDGGLAGTDNGIHRPATGRGWTEPFPTRISGSSCYSSTGATLLQTSGRRLPQPTGSHGLYPTAGRLARGLSGKRCKHSPQRFSGTIKQTTGHFDIRHWTCFVKSYR